MWLEKTSKETQAVTTRRQIVGLALLVAMLAIFAYLAAVFPGWQGVKLGGQILPLHNVIPIGLADTVAALLILAAVYWLSQSPNFQRTTLICPKCNRVTVNAGQTECDCGGAFRHLCEMKWVKEMQTPT
jgi:uncharacterized membrane protein (DUF485 family)